MHVLILGVKYAVELDNGMLHKGRFHTVAQAEDWILSHKVKHVLALIHGTAVHPHNGRLLRFRDKHPDIYGENLLNAE